LSAEAKLEDGTMIATTADAWGPGVDILVVDAEGKTTPAMDGEYKLETGETVVVVDGLVSEIRPMEVEEEVEMEAEISARFEALANRIAALENQNTELSTQLASVTESKTNAETKLKATEKQLVELSKKPAASSVKEVALGKEKSKQENAKKPLAQMSMTERVIANMKHN
jgi:septal ring factor EnvC (AmiA/AmiB activator)